MAKAYLRSLSAICTLVLATLSVAPRAMADPYPPYWKSGVGGADGSGPAVHFKPAPWPATGQWTAYTRNDGTINDPRVQDPSNGGTSPQNYVNVSSGCPDQTLPSIYYYYDATNRVIFFRWRVEQRANNYATGPSAGSASARRTAPAGSRARSRVPLTTPSTSASSGRGS